MENKATLTISEFAKLSGVSRKTLIYYDKIGLFCPETVNPESGYRYYSYLQLDVISAIYALKEIGTPLKDINVYLDKGRRSGWWHCLRSGRPRSTRRSKA